MNTPSPVAHALSCAPVQISTIQVFSCTADRSCGTSVPVAIVSVGSCVPVVVSLACIWLCPLKRSANSIGYMVLRMKKVANPSPAKSEENSNTLTQTFFFCGIVT